MDRPHEIDDFEHYLDQGKVKEKSSNPSEAESLRKRARSKFENMEKLGISDETATDYVENVYESVRMILQSFMAEKGFKPYSHEAIIAYSIDRTGLDMIDANRVNRYRKLRNDLVYRGEAATLEEAEDIRELFLDLENQFV